MKNCCKKWKRNPGHFLGTLIEELIIPISFCPDCGSSLKEEGTCIECEYGGDKGSSISRANPSLCKLQLKCDFKPKQESEYCECENPLCDDCHKFVEPGRDIPIKPKPQLPEKLSYFALDDGSNEAKIVNVYNKLIDYLKEKK